MSCLIFKKLPKLISNHLLYFTQITWLLIGKRNNTMLSCYWTCTHTKSITTSLPNSALHSAATLQTCRTASGSSAFTWNIGASTTWWNDSTCNKIIHSCKSLQISQAASREAPTVQYTCMPGFNKMKWSPGEQYFYSSQGFLPALNLLVPINTLGCREALWEQSIYYKNTTKCPNQGLNLDCKYTNHEATTPPQAYTVALHKCDAGNKKITQQTLATSVQ